MALSIGIVGLPNVGKSTLFNALTDNNILAANYPFATIEPNTGIVPIPDERLQRLADLYTPTSATRLDVVQGAAEQRTESYMKYDKGAAQAATQQSAKSTSGTAGYAGGQAGASRGPRIIPATVTFVDIAGLVAGAHKGEGLGNQFLANIRSCNAICQVVRAFNDPNVHHVDEKHEPVKDIEVINTELVLADLQTVENRLPRIEKETKANPKLKPVFDSVKQAYELLNSNKPLSSASDINKEHLADLQLLSAKPVIYVFNVDESTLNDKSKQAELTALVAPSKAVFVCAKLEDELRGLDDSDAKELLNSYGQDEPGLNQVVHAAYDILGLQSYLTAGEKEVRAWTIPKAATAPQAAGVIHTDFERGFIAAQIVSYPDLIEAGSLAAAKSAGKVRTEGKDYVMQPNDIVDFRFNV